LDLKSGHPFWPTKNGLIANYPILKHDIKCDVAVIGGGITGALVAYQLTQAGVDAIVLDKRDIGWGSTSASTALLQYEIDTPLHELAERIGEDAAARACLACLEAIYKIEQLTRDLGGSCGFERKKSLYLASAKRHVKELQQEYEIRRRHGIQLDLLDESDITSRFSFKRPAALLSYDAAQVDPYRLTYKLLEKATQHGLKVFDRTAVTTFDQTGKGVKLATDRGCKVTARKIVFATGYESQEYLEQKMARLISTYALVSEPLDGFTGWCEQCLIWESARPYVYLRTTDDGRVIIGGEDVDFRDPERRDQLIERKTKKLQDKFRRLFPQTDMDVAYAWAGTFGETKDGLAYIGETPEFPNAYFALGYGGNGINYGVIAAEIIRDAVLGKANPDAELFRFDR
jgi:glycine/D-amino acid oxidase-like deaminating enzyme